MRKSHPSSASKPIALGAISAHARSLDAIGSVANLSTVHAETCTQRQIDIKDQELRSFVVRQSVIRIHCVVAFALTLIAAELFGPVRAQGSGDALGAFIAIASLVIATSARTIGRAVARQRR